MSHLKVFSSIAPAYDELSTTCIHFLVLLTNHSTADQSNVMSLVKRSVDGWNFVMQRTLVRRCYGRNIDGLNFRCDYENLDKWTTAKWRPHRTTTRAPIGSIFAINSLCRSSCYSCYIQRGRRFVGSNTTTLSNENLRPPRRYFRSQ